MSKKHIAIGLSALMALAGCTMEEQIGNEDVPSGKQLTIEASREGMFQDGTGQETRTVRDESDGSVLWVPGDSFSLFYGSGTNGGSRFTTTLESGTASVTTFTGEITAITAGSEENPEASLFWGVYPYGYGNSCDGSSVTMSIPSGQTATPGTFATNTFPSIGRSQGLTMAFYNVCGGVKFSVTKPGIVKATLRSNSGESICGSVRVGFSELGIPEVQEIISGSNEIVLSAPEGECFQVGKNYYFVMLPTTFTRGFTITFETSIEKGVYKRDVQTSIKRSKFAGLSNVDAGVEYVVDEQSVIDRTLSVYDLVADEHLLGRDLYWEQACANDIVWGRTRGFNSLATLSYTGDEYPLSESFDRIYKSITRANVLIHSLLEKQKEGTLSPIMRRSLGEAYFMRAYYHFLAAYRYGTLDKGAPFTTFESYSDYSSEIPDQLASVTDNYSQIVSDLREAESYLPLFSEYDDNNKGRAHKASAAALMAKTYAYWATWDSSQWNNVITCVDRLEQTYGRGLVENYADLFSPDLETGFWNEEYCWGIPSDGGPDRWVSQYRTFLSTSPFRMGIEFPGVSGEDKGWAKFNCWGQFKPSYDIYEEMAKDNVGGEKNVRLATSILEYNDEFVFFGESMRYYSPTNIESGFQINKYMQAFAPVNPISAGYVLDNGSWPCTRVMWPVVRFGDCLLLRSEAYLALGDAASAAADINRIRVRSNLQPLSGNATWTDLYHERRCELAFEMANDHAYDCKRWAVSGADEIKALALAELNSHPRVRHHVDRMDPASTYSVGPYEDYQTPVKVWDDKYITFPYPSAVINNSNGRIQNAQAWR